MLEVLVRDVGFSRKRLRLFQHHQHLNTELCSIFIGPEWTIYKAEMVISGSKLTYLSSHHDLRQCLFRPFYE